MSSEKNATNEEAPLAGTAPVEEEGTNKPKKIDRVSLWTAIIVGLCVLIFCLHILADKYTPYTSNGRIEAFVVPIVPQVSGPLTSVNVVHNQFVTEGQVLAVVDTAKYELAVRRAQADLQLATQTSEADIAAVTTAQARVAEAEANLRNAQVKGQRIIKLSKQGAASLSRADDARSRIEASKAKLASARSELEKAKSHLGETGEDNAKVRSALTALETAQLDLKRSTLRAPSDGIITNLTVDVGHYAATGAPVMTFLATKFVWIQADMRENSLLNIKKDDPVELVLDAAPGHIFKGKVLSVGYGVSDNAGNTLGGLTTVQPSQGWLRQAQHMPVLIAFTDGSAKEFKRMGGQVNVIVYTSNKPVLNTLGRFWIRMISFLSHAY
ncbi:HlyD family secretion protein [Desulfogranum marinum]|uniref:HlyD family secretion protein n=1 Tax=Desulfogranum marinum TaxID=453220 RepID=UPI0019662A00|nr:HlyD family secretion protein [Desulfogranum marinum]MBM9514394.1 HlyD family secretion protein [Desulfogranum marinum]